MMSKRFLSNGVWVGVFAAGLLTCSTPAKADSAPTVMYSVSGSAGDWTLDFTVTNNTGQNLYFFGVLLPANDQTGTPAGWQLFGGDRDNSSFGGSSTVYNNNWVDPTDTGVVTPGNSLSGFEALVTTATAPTNVQFFAYTCDDTLHSIAPPCGGSAYAGVGNFNTVDNPGFEGIATNAVPEPRLETMLLVVAVFGVMAGRKGCAASSSRTPDPGRARCDPTRRDRAN